MTGENYLVSIQQRNCLDGVINGMTTSTGVGWNGIGDNGKARSWREKLGREYGKKRMETILEILPEEESWRGGTVITPGYIEELDNEGRLRNNEYLHYEVTNEEYNGMGEMCNPYKGL